MIDKIWEYLHKKQKNQKMHTPRLDYYAMVLEQLLSNPDTLYTSYSMSSKIRALHNVPITPKTALNCLRVIVKTNKRIRHIKEGNVNYFTVDWM